MATITIKGIPEELYRILKERAARNRRSLNREILFCLEQAACQPPLDPMKWLAGVDRIRDGLEISPLTAARLRQARTKGRP